MVRNIGVLSVLLFFTTASGFAQIQVQPAFHNFGNVRPGKHYTCKVKITNNSAKAVTLSTPSINCECASVTIQQSLLHPKGFTWMTVELNPGENDKGPKFLRAVFTASYKAKKSEVSLIEKDFQVRAQINPFYSFSPEKLLVSYINGQKIVGVDGQLELDDKTYPDWRLVKAETDSNTFTAHVSPQATPSTYSVHLEIPSGLLPGIYSGKILIKGSGKTATEFQYPFQVTVNSIWDVEPRNLQIGALDSPKAKTWKGITMVRQIEGKPFKIQKIEGAPSWLNFDIKNNSTGNCLIHWELDPGKLQDLKAMEKPLPKAIILVTDFPLEKSISVPLNVSFESKLRSKTQNSRPSVRLEAKPNSNPPVPGPKPTPQGTSSSLKKK
ncbi:MAG TPA: hypothetical protein VIJ93_12040 [bacterium]